MSTIKLIAAITYIQLYIHPKAFVSSIGFADDSGNKFDYCINGSTNFIYHADLTGKI